MAVWPQDSPDPVVRAQHYMAVTLVQIPNLTLPRAAISQLGVLLGGAQSLDDSSWHNLLAQDPCFVLGEGPSGDPTVRLNASQLRQRAHELGIVSSSGVDGSGGDGGSSSGDDGGSSDSEQRDDGSSDSGSSSEWMLSELQVSVTPDNVCA